MSVLMAGYADAGNARFAIDDGRHMRKKELAEILEFAVDHIFIKVNNSPIVIEENDYCGYFTDHYISTETLLICDVCRESIELTEGMTPKIILEFFVKHRDCEKIAFPRHKK